MAELVDALASGASGRKVVGVQVSPWAPPREIPQSDSVQKFVQTATFLAFLGAGLIACAGSAPIDPHVQKLQWLDAADPQADANHAVKQNDLRLLGLATRSVHIPGVTQGDQLKYEEACGVQLIAGISDVVRSNEHLRLMQKARSYALKYNAIIKTHCQP